MYYRGAAVERAMRIQEVVMRAISESLARKVREVLDGGRREKF